MNQYGYQPPQPTQRPRASAAGVVVGGVLLALVAAAVSALFSLGMLFATDSCGTGGSGGDARVCDGGTWGAVVALPWVGLAGGVVVGVAMGVARARQGRATWPALLTGLGVYVVLLAASAVTVFG